MEEHIFNSVIVFKVPFTFAEFCKVSVACCCNVAEASEKVDLYLVSIAVETLEPLGVNIFLATVFILFAELFIVWEKVNISVCSLCQPGKVVHTDGINLDFLSLYIFVKEYTCHFSKDILSAEYLVATTESFDFRENSVKSLYAKSHGVSVVDYPGVG